MALLKTHLLNWLAQWSGLGSSTTAVSHWTGWESVPCSVYEAGCLSSSSLVLKSWGIPGGVYAVCIGSPKKLFLTQWRTVATAGQMSLSKSEGKEAKSSFCPPPPFYPVCHPKVWPIFQSGCSHFIRFDQKHLLQWSAIPTNYCHSLENLFMCAFFSLLFSCFWNRVSLELTM